MTAARLPRALQRSRALSQSTAKATKAEAAALDSLAGTAGLLACATSITLAVVWLEVNFPSTVLNATMPKVKAEKTTKSGPMANLHHELLSR